MTRRDSLKWIEVDPPLIFRFLYRNIPDMEGNHFVLYSLNDRIATITLNRPEKRNALNFEMVRQLKEAFHRAEQDSFVKIVVLKANGEAFCAGADLDYLQQLQAYSFEENLADSNHLMELFLQIYKMPKVVVAQIEGHALAGGCGLATVCDLAFAVPDAKFGYTEVRIGFIPAIVMYFLLRKAGETKAKELLLTGDLITAEAAARNNLITRVIEAEYIQQFVAEFAQRLCSQNSASSMALTKKMIADLPTMPVSEALGFAARMNAHARNTDECRKGIAAFLNKEKLVW